MSQALFDLYKEALRRGHVAAVQGNLDAALTAYEAAATIAPDRALPHASVGDVLKRLGRFDEAEHAYDAALQRAPADEGALRGRAATRLELRRAVDAARDLEALADVLERANRIPDACNAACAALEIAETRSRRQALERLADALTGLAGEPGAAAALVRAEPFLDPNRPRVEPEPVMALAPGSLDWPVSTFDVVVASPPEDATNPLGDDADGVEAATVEAATVEAAVATDAPAPLHDAPVAADEPAEPEPAVAVEAMPEPEPASVPEPAVAADQPAGIDGAPAEPEAAELDVASEPEPEPEPASASAEPVAVSEPEVAPQTEVAAVLDVLVEPEPLVEPETVEPPVEPRARFHVVAARAEAESLLIAGDHQRARPLLLRIAQAEREAGRLDAAIDACLILVTINPADTAVQLELATIQAARGWTDLARDKIALLARLADLNDDPDAQALVQGSAVVRDLATTRRQDRESTPRL